MIDQREALAQLSTLGDFLRWGASRFEEAGLVYGHGTDNALDEAATLVFHALHLSHDLASQYLGAVLTESEKKAVVGLLVRRIEERKPAAYLTREAWFGGWSFYVDERVLVPRSPIAELVEGRFSPWVIPDEVGRILDLCTGSGCIAVACAHAFPEAAIDAADLSVNALEVARINVQRHHLEHRVRLVQSDLFEALTGERYDIIVSNPPYVPAGEISHLPQEYRHEPVVGLESGPSGLDAAMRILRGARGHLAPNGVLVVEVGHGAERLTEVLPRVPFMWLEFERGGEGVFLLTAEQLEEHGDELAYHGSGLSSRP